MNRYVLDLEKELEEYKKMVREALEILKDNRVGDSNMKSVEVPRLLNAIEDAIIKLEELE